MTQQDAILAQIGAYKGGPKRITGGGAVTGKIYAIQPINGEAVFSALTFNNDEAFESGDSIPEGVPLVSPIKSFTLTSGVVLVWGENIVQA